MTTAEPGNPATCSCISTGELPDAREVQTVVNAAYAAFKDCDEGMNADYIPALATVPRDRFGICMAATSGELYEAGDTGDELTIQSISKPFVFGLICQALGEEEARQRLGVNSTGLPFNCVIAVDRSAAGQSNPMVNAGAIAATSLAPGASAAAKWRFLHLGLSRFAGRTLALDEEVYRSEAAANRRNQGIAQLLHAGKLIDFDPVQATDLYTRQCALRVTTRDLAVMAATLANGGVNPLTGKPVIDEIHSSTCWR